MAQMSTIVVSAADETYAGLLLDLVDSLRAAAVPDLRIGCLDLGLTEATRGRLGPLVDATVRPEWPFRPHPVFGASPRHLSRAVRPFLPEYFPGHTTYIWLDADCWVQDRMALQGLTHAASGGALAVVPAADRSYIHSDDARGWVDRRYRMALGDDAADRLRPFSYINCGVLALRAQSPHWVAWERRFQAALDRWEGDFLSDQAVLNALVYLDAMPSVMLPAEYNWVCHLRLPLWLAEKRRFANPNYPWTPIGILHNTLNDKDKGVAVLSTDGTVVSTVLSYAGFKALAMQATPQQSQG